MSFSFLRGRRAVATLLLAGASVAVAPAALAADPPDLAGGCSDPTGVTVVVDATDLGGTLEVGCATSAATGTEALETAGFAPSKDAAGMICAIDAAPDPCPATFTGQYWSYWTAPADGDWQMSMEGSDTAVPTPGAVEGWRYGDGSAGPGAAPADVLAAAAGGSGNDASAEPTEVAPSPEVSAEALTVAGSGDDGLPTWVPVAVGAAVLAAAVGAVVAVRRRGGDGYGPAAQD